MNVETWTIADLIDLEYFLSRDEEQDDSSAVKRDRRIYLLAVEPRISPEEVSTGGFRRRAVRIWLEERRKLYRKQQGRDAALPGNVFFEARSILAALIGIIGLFAGAGAAFSLLVYTGEEPVNVSAYLGILVFLQILGLLMMARFIFLKTSLNAVRRYSLVYTLMSRLLERMAVRLARSALASVSGGKRTEAGEISGTVRGMYGVYGRVLFWPVFSLVQLFGVLFNAGAIGATLIRVMTADLAFGWQSTLQMSSQSVHTLVRVLAAPWSWLLGQYAHPSLAQIEGSRIVLKEGIAPLSTASLVSWWPFLVAAVVFYGLLPRLVFLGVSLAGKRRSLTRLDFTHASCERLMMRMQSPTVSTQGLPGPSGLSGAQLAEAKVEFEPFSLKHTDAAVLVPEDIYRRCDRGDLEQHLKSLLGWGFAYLFPVTGEMMEDRSSIDAAVQIHSANGGAAVLIQEAWQPPIIEIIRVVRELRARGGKEMRIAVLLIGKPGAGTIFTPVKPTDREIWSRVLASLGDPYLRVVAVGEQ
jgi:hypothetical protein